MDTTNNDNQSNSHADLVIKRQVQVNAISKAIYLITDFFDNSEPLKLSLRKMVVNCVEDDNNINFIKLNSLIKLANNIKLISDMNSDLLIRAIDSYLFNTKKIEFDSNKEINIDNILNTAETDNITVDFNQNETKNIIEKIDIKQSSSIENPKIVKNVNNDDKKISNITINNNTQNIKTINNISMDIGSRRKKILEIVKARGAVTINEFIESIKGISSKTIQRELTSLVLSGTLKKTGERRWSKYSLK